LGFFNQKFSSIWRTLRLKNDLIKDGISHFHGLSHELPYGINKTEIKTVVSIHDLIAIRYPQYFKKADRVSYVKKSRYACEIADKIIAVSQQTKEDIIRFFNISEDKIEVVYQGCNKIFQEEQKDDFKEVVRSRYQLPKQYLLYVGTIEERKNLISLLKCLKELPNYQLVVIGNGKKYKTECLNFIHTHKMNNRVLMLSDLSLKEMAAIYQQADIMIYPSFFEGFGIPILESLFSGVPVITSQGGCFSEPGGAHSSYINPNDIEQMKNEILDISTNKLRRKKMIEEGKKHAQNFTDDKIAERLIELYRTI
jgi:glycosyltransferase involved in cell wall biosynthesis